MLEPFRLLIIDDEKYIPHSSFYYLDDLGYEVETGKR